MKKRRYFKASVLTIFILGSILSILAFPYRYKIIRNVKVLLGYHLGSTLTGTGSCKKCSTLFTDNVKTHQQAYKGEGIQQQKNDDGLQSLFKKRKLLKLTSTPLYTVRPLSHSQPFILLKGQIFIDELARLYEKKCIRDSLNYVPFTISSVTRSIESVKRLGAVNLNSIENSAHLRGKTFDISYRAFNNNNKQNEAFISVLRDMRLQGRCYVKFEKNGCLHITVI